MPEQLICPRCGTPNAPTAASCYYCGWAPSVGPQDGGNPAAGGYGGAPGPGGPGPAGPGQGPASGGDPYAGGSYGNSSYGAGSYGDGQDTVSGDNGPHGFGDDAHGPTFAGAYGAGQVGAASGGYDAAGSGGYDQGGSYGGYGQGDFGQGGYGAGYPGGPGSTQLRGDGGGQPPAGPQPAGAADKPDRNKLLMIGAGVVGGLVVIALVVFVILRFLSPGNGDTTGPGPGPGPSPSSQTKPTSGSSPSKTPSPSSTPTPAAPNYDKIAGQVKSGVLKVYATACGNDATRVGTAFLIANDTAVASYASLAGAQVVAVSTGSGLVSASVSSADVDHGIVILKLNRSVGGHIFAIDTSTAKAGDPVGLLGYAAAASTAKVETTKITGTGQAARVGSSSIGGLDGTALASDDGWAGAPTLSSTGAANGMVMAGPGAAQVMIVPGAAIKAAETSGGQLPGGTCNDPRGPAVTTIGGTPTQAVKATLYSYFNGINTGDYHTAYEQLGPHSNNGPFSGYVSGWRSAYDFNITVHSVSGSGNGTHARVGFDSITLPGQGPKGHTEATCAHWDMGYTFVDNGGRLLINDVTANASLC